MPGFRTHAYNTIDRVVNLRSAFCYKKQKAVLETLESKYIHFDSNVSVAALASRLFCIQIAFIHPSLTTAVTVTAALTATVTATLH